ncbi:hypothetical protein G4Z16_19720 [Streptomyces bathyalis]|uniref:Uncharacterized protein n=1 Tax=Streptomyces bathyalis TaxID=2710756 RepID=A0A7T1T8B7_9ACTN|nr:hypothetical protein G4Z16_19720 [Streptomyces bathyalis]
MSAPPVEQDRQRPVAVRDEGFHLVKILRRYRQAQSREAVEERGKRRTGFHAREGGAQTEVHAVL